MAKELPYFKFEVSEWMTGEITLESLECQGLFINICALYWKKNGVLKISEIEKRFSKKKLLASLLQSIIKSEDGFIIIKFLDEQFAERQVVSDRNSDIAKERWAKTQSERNATALPTEKSGTTKVYHLEEEEEVEKNKKKELEKEQKKELTAPKTVRPQNEFYEVFNQWFISIAGVPYLMKKKDWVGIAEIKKYCDDNSKGFVPLDSFKWILNNFDKLPPYFQQNRNPSFIASRISDIIGLIKSPAIDKKAGQTNLVEMHIDAVNKSNHPESTTSNLSNLLDQ